MTGEIDGFKSFFGIIFEVFAMLGIEPSGGRDGPPADHWPRPRTIMQTDSTARDTDRNLNLYRQLGADTREQISAKQPNVKKTSLRALFPARDELKHRLAPGPWGVIQFQPS